MNVFIGKINYLKNFTKLSQKYTGHDYNRFIYTFNPEIITHYKLFYH